MMRMIQHFDERGYDLPLCCRACSPSHKAARCSLPVLACSSSETPANCHIVTLVHLFFSAFQYCHTFLPFKVTIRALKSRDSVQLTSPPKPIVSINSNRNQEPHQSAVQHQHQPAPHLEVRLHILQVLLQLCLDVVDIGCQAAQRALRTLTKVVYSYNYSWL